MSETILTSERILETAEDVLRRFGPAKTTVVDVARALGVSHGSVYRHFPSKAALRDAVAERWLARVSEPLEVVLQQDLPAPIKLRRWFDALFTSKRSKLLNDPELFATYMEIAVEAREVVAAHVDHLCAHISQIISEGVASGEFSASDPARTGRAVFMATVRFHNPVHASEWSDPTNDEQFEDVWELILHGLTR